VAAKSNLIFGHADALSTAAAAVSLAPAYLEQDKGALRDADDARSIGACSVHKSSDSRASGELRPRCDAEIAGAGDPLFSSDAAVADMYICRRVSPFPTSSRPSASTSYPCSRPTPLSLVFRLRRRKRPMCTGTLQSKGTVSKDARARRSATICAGANPQTLVDFFDFRRFFLATSLPAIAVRKSPRAPVPHIRYHRGSVKYRSASFTSAHEPTSRKLQADVNIVLRAGFYRIEPALQLLDDSSFGSTSLLVVQDDCCDGHRPA
jgi:hypothetical protein